MAQTMAPQMLRERQSDPNGLDGEHDVVIRYGYFGSARTRLWLWMVASGGTTKK